MPPITSPHSIFASDAAALTLETARAPASQSKYCYLFPDLVADDSVGCFAGTTPEQTFARLEAFEESSRRALTRMPVLPMRLPPVYTYFGQFVNHDISAPVGDVVSRPARPMAVAVIGTNDPPGFDRARRAKASIILANFRNEQPNPLSLDSLYGDGPGSTDAEIAALYEPDGKRFRLGQTRRDGDKVFSDMKRNPARVVHATGARDLVRKDGKPLIADRRNDENLIISQLHLALLLFHNKAVAALEGDFPDPAKCFDKARELVTLHYHWLILHDYLPNLLSPTVLQTPLADRPQRLPGRRMVPLEFTTAAFRFGHSMIGSAYDFNQNFGRGRRLAPLATLAQLFDFTTHRNMGQAVAETLQLPDHWVIDWDRMSRPAPLNGAAPAHGAERIDLTFAPGMLNSMGSSASAVHGSILFRNLVRGFHRRIPFGQALARACGGDPLDEAAVRAMLPGGSDANPAFRGLREIAEDMGFLRETPAWLYFLAEARHHEQGERVGPTASAIIADTMVGLMRFMEGSVLNHDGGRWHPAQSPLLAKGRRGLTSLRAFFCFAVEGTGVRDMAAPVAEDLVPEVAVADSVGDLLAAELVAEAPVAPA